MNSDSMLRDLIGRLETLETLLQNSADSDWAHETPDELIRELSRLRLKLQTNSPAVHSELKHLFVPTGSLNEIAMENGWFETYAETARLIDAL